MRLEISHRLEFRSAPGAKHSLRRLRLCPHSSDTQVVRSWSISVEGAAEEVRFTDAYGNHTRLLSIDGSESAVAVEASGVVETLNAVGLMGEHRGLVPLWLYLRETALTRVDETVVQLVSGLAEDSDLGRLHTFMGALASASEPATRAERAEVGLNQRQHQNQSQTGDGRQSQNQSQYREQGVEIDPNKATARSDADTAQVTHRFIAAARQLGLPARYLCGYRLADDLQGLSATHAWAEAHVGSLGWVAFDVVNDFCPDDRYVRVSSGRDARDAATVGGVTPTTPDEVLAIRVSEEQ